MEPAGRIQEYLRAVLDRQREAPTPRTSTLQVRSPVGIV
jgi:hypothetical protein